MQNILNHMFTSSQLALFNMTSLFLIPDSHVQLLIETQIEMVSVCDPARIHHQHTLEIATRLYDGPLQPICLHLNPSKGFNCNINWFSRLQNLLEGVVQRAVNSIPITIFVKSLEVGVSWLIEIIFIEEQTNVQSNQVQLTRGSGLYRYQLQHNHVIS